MATCCWTYSLPAVRRQALIFKESFNTVTARNFMYFRLPQIMLTHQLLLLFAMPILIVESIPIKRSKIKSCASSKNHKEDFLKLITNVTASLHEAHLGDHMLPICPHLTQKPSFDQELQEWIKVGIVILPSRHLLSTSLLKQNLG